MNNLYRLVWNNVTQSWQVVSELAKSKVKSSCNKSVTELDFSLAIKTIILTNVIGLSSFCFAAPTGGTVSTGTASITVSNKTTTINQSTARAAINWSNFSTAADEIITFVQPSTSSVTLNRVTSTAPSILKGTLTATGQVFIVNPNGVTFDGTSQVNTTGLVASTLGISNTNFMNGVYNFANSTNNKIVENRGLITTIGTAGTVALIAPNVKNLGTITASEGSVLLAAGSDVTINLSNNSLLSYTINQGKANAVINSAGTIKANGGKVILNAKGVSAINGAVVNSLGIIEAQTVNNKRGVIELSADFTSGVVNVSNKLDASAPTTGNGGLIKTSASQVNVSNGTVISTDRINQSTLAPTTSGWELTANNVDVNFFGGTVNSSTLNSALSKGNVTLKSVGAGVDQGNININDSVDWSTNTGLTLTATKDINFNSDVSLTGDKAKLAMNFGSSNDYNLNNGSKITISGATPTLLINGTNYTVINSLGEEGDASTTSLQGIQNNLTGNYVLGTDIDASDTVNWNNGEGFDPIGKVVFQTLQGQGVGIPVATSGTAFTGKFHGFGHSVDNLLINKGTAVGLPNLIDEQVSTPTGLFSTVEGNLRDINLVNVNVTGDNYTGSLVGMHKDGIIRNAHSSGVVSGKTAVGGLVGYAGLRATDYIPTGKIEASSSSASTKGLIAVGGLAGVASNPVYNSYAAGDVGLANLTLSAEELSNLDVNELYAISVGGLVGFGSGIYNSYATGNILSGTNINGTFNDQLGFTAAGGLIGMIFSDNRNYFIDNSYATGNVTGSSILGGLAGGTLLENDLNFEKLSIRNSHATGNVSALNILSTQPGVGDNVGGLIGAHSDYHVIESSYATGSVSGNRAVGGFVGSNSGIIRNSYSTGSVVGGNGTGGFVGEMYGGSIENSYTLSPITSLTNYQYGGFAGYQFPINTTISNSYWNTDISGFQSAGGTGVTSTDFNQIGTFTSWDIADINDPNSTSLWVIDENNSAPTLRYNP